MDEPLGPRPDGRGGVLTALVTLTAIVALLGTACTATPPSTAGPGDSLSMSSTEPAPSVSMRVTGGPSSGDGPPSLDPAETQQQSGAPEPPVWSLVADADLELQDGVMHDVVATEVGLVAVGGGRDEALQVPVAAIWVSDDGLDWQRAVLEGDAARGQISAVVATGSGLVAVGNECCPDRAAVWTSADGLTWQRVEDQGAFAGGAMTGIASWAGGLVAVGCISDGGCAGTAIWISGNGDAWERVELDPELGSTQLSDVTASGSVLVAVGSSGAVPAQAPEILVSLDGQAWAHVDAPPGAASLTAVAAGGEGIIAAGGATDPGDGRPTALVISSVDGAEWTAVESAAFTGGTVEDIGVIGSGYVAVGRLRRVAATWYTLERQDWQRAIAGPNGTMTAVTDAAGGRLVAVGTLGDGAQSRPAVWVSPGA